jgi:hypothetical protein
MLRRMSRDQRAHLYGEVNDRIFELLEVSEPGLPGEFLCECGSDCGRRVLLLPAAFAVLRRDGEAVRARDCHKRSCLRGVPALI